MTTFTYTDELLECEKLVEAGSGILLLRQVGANVWDEVNEVPTELAFAPQAADHRKPSLSQGDDAQAARDWHQKHAASPSLGVWAVSGSEVAMSGLRAIDDSLCPEKPGTKKAPNHCYLDYRGLNKPQMREARLYLLMAAVQRKELPTTDIGHHLAGTA